MRIIVVFVILAGIFGQPVPPEPVVKNCYEGAQWENPPMPLELTFRPGDDFTFICQIIIYEGGEMTTYTEDASGVSGLGTHTITVDNPGEIFYMYAAGPFYRVYLPVSLSP